MLQKVADFYEDEVNAAVKSLTSILEPIMMLASARSSVWSSSRCTCDLRHDEHRQAVAAPPGHVEQRAAGSRLRGHRSPVGLDQIVRDNQRCCITSSSASRRRRAVRRPAPGRQSGAHQGGPGFDPTKGVRFRPTPVPVIEGEVRHHCATRCCCASRAGSRGST